MINQMGNKDKQSQDQNSNKDSKNTTSSSDVNKPTDINSAQKPPLTGPNTYTPPKKPADGETQSGDKAANADGKETPPAKSA